MPHAHARWLEFFNEISTTNLRIVVTLLCLVITTVAYVFGFYEMSWEWLAFLATMSGIDVAQYTSQRVTYNPESDKIKHQIRDKE